MKKNFLRSTGPAALLAAFLLGLFVPAGARAQGNGQAPAQAAAHERDHSVWLRIMAFTDAPIVGADVRVSVHGRLLADAKAATNDQGVFPVRIWQPWILGEETRRANWRSFVRISISGGTTNGNPFPGHLTADVVLTDPAHQILVVNPVTTLVSLVLDRRPELKLDQAETLVRRFLGLPTNYSLGLALRQGSHYVSRFFSPVVLLKEAQAAGGLEAFEQLLLQELESGSTHPFGPPQLLGSTGSSDAISIMKAGLYAGALDVANAAGVENLAGWALSYTGLVPTPQTTQADIDALTGAISDLQSSINNLSSQINQLTQLVEAIAIQNTQSQYITITTTAQTLANQVNDEENRLMYLAQDCPPLAAGSAPPEPTDFCTTEPGRILSDLSSQPIYSSYTNVQSYVQDNGTLGTQGMLHLYSLWLSQSKRFFRPADSTKMQNLYDYWDGVLTQAADLKMELLHQEGEQNSGGHQLIAFMGNPDATPPTTGTFQANENANLTLMFPAVPLRTVVDTMTRFMWETDMPTTMACIIGSNGNPPAISSAPYVGYYAWNGFPNWTSPAIEDLQTLTNGAGGGSPMAWLISQTNAVSPDYPQSKGFPDIVDEPYLPPYNCTSQRAVWSIDPAPTPPNSNPLHYVFDFKDGATEVSSQQNVGYWLFLRRPLDQKGHEQYYWYPVN